MTEPAEPVVAARAEPVPVVTPTPLAISWSGPDVEVPSSVTVETGDGADPAAVDVVGEVLRAAGATEVEVRAANDDAGGRRGDDGRRPRRPRRCAGRPGTRRRARHRRGHPAGRPGARGLRPRRLHALRRDGPGRAGRGGPRRHVLRGADAAAARRRQHDRRGRASPTSRPWPTAARSRASTAAPGRPRSGSTTSPSPAGSSSTRTSTPPRTTPTTATAGASPTRPTWPTGCAVLVEAAAANHVRFTFAVSPGVSICYSDPADLAALTAKFEALHALGVRAFSVALDDIDHTTWNCPADADRYGPPSTEASARAQVELLNAVQAGFVAAHPDVLPLQMVPTEYRGTGDSPYRAVAASRPHPGHRGDVDGPVRRAGRDHRRARHGGGRDLRSAALRVGQHAGQRLPRRPRAA